MMMQEEIATVGGGCFWCVEAVFQRVRGVRLVESGYSGGKTSNPTYEQICRGDSQHAEVVRIHFDPAVITYPELLEIFFTTHDPTTLNQQGNDVGTQYRSVIYTHSEEQMQIAKKVMHDMAAIWDAPIVTELLEAPIFYVAEDYHQNYFVNNPNQPYCAYVVAPKVDKLRKYHADKLK
jgi:peptide-methionine (S)-S-oxide reductase